MSDQPRNTLEDTRGNTGCGNTGCGGVGAVYLGLRNLDGCTVTVKATSLEKPHLLAMVKGDTLQARRRRPRRVRVPAPRGGVQGKRRGDHAGLGGGARGFNAARARVGTWEADWRCIGGVDVDEASVRDFERLAGAPGTVLDLFDRAGYAAFHGEAPPDNWREATPDDLQAVTGGGTPTSGGQAVADPRARLGGRWGAGHYGIIPWEEPAGAVTSAKHDNGRAAVADPRVSENPEGQRESGAESPLELPGDREQGAYTIIALDGTWHRPLTTLELATLQGLLDPGDWSPFDGTSHSAWRERIGNAVPSPAAEAIGGVIGRALLAHWSGTYLQATLEAPWCLPIVAAWEAAR